MTSMILIAINHDVYSCLSILIISSLKSWSDRHILKKKCMWSNPQLNLINRAENFFCVCSLVCLYIIWLKVIVCSTLKTLELINIKKIWTTGVYYAQVHGMVPIGIKVFL